MNDLQSSVQRMLDQLDCWTRQSNSSTDHIISKYFVFNFNNSRFPLKLKTIVLGPNSPAAAVNRRQLQVMLADQGIKGVAVKLSKIDSYRKS